MRKPDFSICKNNGADQLRVNRTADKCLCFHYIDSITHLPPKTGSFKPLATFCGCTARFVSDLVGNSEDRFCCDTTHIQDASCLTRSETPKQGFLVTCFIFIFQGHSGLLCCEPGSSHQGFDWFYVCQDSHPSQ